MTEFAIVLPMLAMLLFGIIQFGILYNNYVTVTDAARGARKAAVSRHTDPNDGCDTARSSAATLEPGAARLLGLGLRPRPPPTSRSTSPTPTRSRPAGRRRQVGTLVPAPRSEWNESSSQRTRQTMVLTTLRRRTPRHGGPRARPDLVLVAARPPGGRGRRCAAGAQELPDSTGLATARATEYTSKNNGPSPGVSFSSTVSGFGADTIHIELERPAPGFFAKVFGVDLRRHPREGGREGRLSVGLRAGSRPSSWTRSIRCCSAARVRASAR